MHTLVVVFTFILYIVECAFAGQLLNIRQSSSDVAEPTVGKFKRQAGLLFKNGEKTSCELVILSVSSAFIAASCFDYLSGTTVDTSVKYEVRVNNDGGTATTGVATLNPSDIHIHPNFNPTTLANNIAVISYYYANVGSYNMVFATEVSKSDAFAYVRSVYDEPTDLWSLSELFDGKSDEAGCSEASGLYQSNINSMLCMRATLQSPEDGNCRVPSGASYRTVQSSLNYAALFSHSVVYGNSTCGQNIRVYNYYTILEQYFGFASKVLNQPISYRDLTTTGKIDDKTINRMNDVSASIVPGTKILSGNMYSPREVVINIPASAAPAANKDNNTPTPTSTPTPASALAPAPAKSTTLSSPSATSNPDSAKSDTTSGHVKESKDPLASSNSSESGLLSSIESSDDGVASSGLLQDDIDSQGDVMADMKEETVPSSTSSSGNGKPKESTYSKDRVQDAPNNGSSSRKVVLAVAIIVPLVAILCLGGGLVIWIRSRRRRVSKSRVISTLQMLEGTHSSKASSKASSLRGNYMPGQINPVSTWSPRGSHASPQGSRFSALDTRNNSVEFTEETFARSSRPVRSTFLGGRSTLNIY